MIKILLLVLSLVCASSATFYWSPTGRAVPLPQSSASVAANQAGGHYRYTVNQQHPNYVVRPQQPQFAATHYSPPTATHFANFPTSAHYTAPAAASPLAYPASYYPVYTYNAPGYGYAFSTY